MASNVDTTTALVGILPLAFGKSGASGSVERELSESHAMWDTARWYGHGTTMCPHIQGQVRFTPRALWSDLDPGRFHVISLASSSNVHAETLAVLASISRKRKITASRVKTNGLQGPRVTRGSSVR